MRVVQAGRVAAVRRRRLAQAFAGIASCPSPTSRRPPCGHWAADADETPVVEALAQIAQATRCPGCSARGSLGSASFPSAAIGGGWSHERRHHATTAPRAYALSSVRPTPSTWATCSVEGRDPRAVRGRGSRRSPAREPAAARAEREDEAYLVPRPATSRWATSRRRAGHLRVLPRSVPHGSLVRSDVARFLGVTPGGLEGHFHALRDRGSPSARSAALPEAPPVDAMAPTWPLRAVEIVPGGGRSRPVAMRRRPARLAASAGSISCTSASWAARPRSCAPPRRS